jgi:hypothetical protein
MQPVLIKRGKCSYRGDVPRALSRRIDSMPMHIIIPTQTMEERYVVIQI